MRFNRLFAFIVAIVCVLAPQKAYAWGAGYIATSSISEGDVLVWDLETAEEGVKVCTSAYATNIAGIADQDANIGEIVTVWVEGARNEINATTGTRGQWVVTSAVSGKAMGVDEWQPGVFGVFLTDVVDGKARARWSTALSYTSSEHGALTGLADDDHSQYHNDTRGDARYLNIGNTDPFTPDADYEPATKKYVDDNAGETDHGALSGLADDDHSQYHNDTRGDARYLNIANTDPFTPDADYEPATKKYVDDNAGETPSDSTPAAVADTGAAGSSDNYARGDHAHKGISSIQESGDEAARFGVIQLLHNARMMSDTYIAGVPSVDGYVPTFNSTSGEIEWEAPPGLGGGEANDGSNVGGGAEVFKEKSGLNLVLRTLQSLNAALVVYEETDTIDLAIALDYFRQNWLAKDNTDGFTPDADYEPATKKYVDDNSGLKNIVEDETPQLGGPLEANGNKMGSIVLPGTDPDVGTAGDIGADTDDHSLRGYDGAAQYVYAQKLKPIAFSVLDPENIPTDAGRSTKCLAVPMISGFTFHITYIKAGADEDDYTFTLFKSASLTDMSTGADTQLDVVACSTDGTGTYTANITSGFDSGTIESGTKLIFEHTSGTAGHVDVEIGGYYDANVD